MVCKNILSQIDSKLCDFYEIAKKTVGDSRNRPYTMDEAHRRYVQLLELDVIPQLSLNCVIFGFHDKKLQVVVNRLSFGHNKLMVLPGGFVLQNEDLDMAVKNMIKESTGWADVLVQQFAVFGGASRSFGADLAKGSGIESAVIQWFSRRFVSVCYLALVDYQKSELQPSLFFESAEWLPIEQANALSMDHADILSSALKTLAKEIPYTPIAANLLPGQFTLPDLLALVEAILERKIDRPNFRRKILKTGRIVKVGTENTGKGRPADLYEFKGGRDTSLIDAIKLGF